MSQAGLAVTILGSNSAYFAHGRHHTAQIIQIGQGYTLMDCGEGTQLRLKACGIKASKIKRIFISHLHGDHFFGLPGLLSTLHLMGRGEKLELIGPEGLGAILTQLFKSSGSVLNYELDLKELPFAVGAPAQTVYEDQHFFVKAFPMQHRIPCFGYRFEEQHKPRKIKKDRLPQGLGPEHFERLKHGEAIEFQGEVFTAASLTESPKPSKSYAFCSDTIYDPELVQHFQGVDMLYHEATFLNDNEKRAAQTFHSTARQAAQNAKEGQVGKLLLGHFSSRYKDLGPVLEEAKAVFEESHLALEGETFIA